MTSSVLAVHADTSVQDIARLLLENHISAVPVLDAAGAPIGMVSEGDPIGRNESERQARQDWWLALLAEGDRLDADFLSNILSRDRTARDVMTTPVISVSEDTDVAEIARVLVGMRVKRAPVLRNGKVVGIVSRENLLRAIPKPPPPRGTRVKSWLLPHSAAESSQAQEHDASATSGPPDDAKLNVGDFRRLVDEFENHAQQLREAARRGVADQHRRKVAELIDRHLSDDSWRSLVHRAREAAERGEAEFLLLRFPSELCSDGGRAVNAPEPDWPATLRGEAAEIYLRWETDLAPHGFHIAARVVEFPGGVPGDIGLYLVWR